MQPELSEAQSFLVGTGAIQSLDLFGWNRSYPKPSFYVLMPKPKTELLDRLGRWLLILTVKTKFLLNSSFLPIFFRLHCFLSCMFLPLINYFYCLMINSNSRKLNLLIFCFMYIRLHILCFADSIDDGSSP